MFTYAFHDEVVYPQFTCDEDTNRLTVHGSLCSVPPASDLQSSNQHNQLVAKLICILYRDKDLDDTGSRYYIG